MNIGLIDYFNIEQVKKELVEKVMCNRLDNIIVDQKIDFIKIDVEGNEMRVLYGMEKIIRNIKVLQIEFGGTWIDSRFFYRDLYDYLKKYNFDLLREIYSQYENIDKDKIKHVIKLSKLDKLFNTWTPREKYELINVNEVKEDTINHEFLY